MNRCHNGDSILPSKMTYCAFCFAILDLYSQRISSISLVDITLSTSILEILNFVVSVNNRFEQLIAMVLRSMD